MIGRSAAVAALSAVGILNGLGSAAGLDGYGDDTLTRIVSGSRKGRCLADGEVIEFLSLVLAKVEDHVGQILRASHSSGKRVAGKSGGDGSLAIARRVVGSSSHVELVVIGRRLSGRPVVGLDHDSLIGVGYLDLRSHVDGHGLNTSTLLRNKIHSHSLSSGNVTGSANGTDAVVVCVVHFSLGTMLTRVSRMRFFVPI